MISNNKIKRIHAQISARSSMNDNAGISRGRRNPSQAKLDATSSHTRATSGAELTFTTNPWHPTSIRPKLSQMSLAPGCPPSSLAWSSPETEVCLFKSSMMRREVRRPEGSMEYFVLAILSFVVSDVCHITAGKVGRGHGQ